MPPSRVTTRPRPTSRRSERFCFALPRCATGALPFAVSMKVAKLVMSSATDEQSSPMRSTIRSAIVAAGPVQFLQRDGVHRVPEPAVVQHRRGDLRERGAAVVAHQSANPSLEHGATTRFSAASARYVPVLAPASARRAPQAPSMMPATPRSSSTPHAAAAAPKSRCCTRSGSPSPPAAHRRGQLLRGAQVLLRDDPGLAVHAGGLHQVVVSGAAALLPDTDGHNSG